MSKDPGLHPFPVVLVLLTPLLCVFIIISSSLRHHHPWALNKQTNDAPESNIALHKLQAYNPTGFNIIFIPGRLVWYHHHRSAGPIFSWMLVVAMLVCWWYYDSALAWCTPLFPFTFLKFSHLLKLSIPVALYNR